MRPDLSQRTGLSKTLLTAWELCERKAWFSKWGRRPFIPSEGTVFGNAIDMGVETIIRYHRMGRPIREGRVLRMAMLRGQQDDIALDADEVRHALALFEVDVVPEFDWTHAITQHHLRTVVEGWGPADGHPDLILPADEDSVWDVKAPNKVKQTAKTLELGYYAVTREAETGVPVREVGYLAYVRTGGGYWQGFGDDALHDRPLKSGPRAGQMVTEGHPIPRVFVDDVFRDWTLNIVDGFRRSDRLDDQVNKRREARGLPPENWTMNGMPKNGGLCRTCEYSPQLGGACRVAVLQGDNR